MQFLKDAVKLVLPVPTQKRISRHLRAWRGEASQGGRSRRRDAFHGAPAWLLPGEASEGGAGRPVGLSTDLWLHPDPTLRDPGHVSQIRLHPREDADALARLAVGHPDVLLEIFLDRLARLGCEDAILVDLDDPAVQVFARACRLAHVRHIHAPVAGPVAEPGGGSGRPSHDAVLPRTPELGTAEAGPAPVAPGADRTLPPMRRVVVVWLTDRAWLRPDADRLRVLLRALAAEAAASSAGLDLVLSDWLRDRLPGDLHDELLFSPIVRFRRVLHPAEIPSFVLDRPVVVMADGSRATLIAARAGVARIDLCGLAAADGPPAESGAPPPEIEVARVVAALLVHHPSAPEDGSMVDPDGAADAADGFPPPGSMGHRLGAMPRPSRRATRADVIAGRHPAGTVVASGISPEGMETKYRHIEALLGIEALSLVDDQTPLLSLLDVDVFVQWGLRPNRANRRLLTACRKLQGDLLILEDGFVRSVEIGLQDGPTCSIVMDDMTAFFDATRPSRLETILNGDAAFDADALARAERAIALLTATKVSKYNFAPYKRVERPDPARKVVLVVDQRAGDMSLELGMAGDDAFEAMLDAALALSDDHDVLIKTHPDATIGGKESAIGADRLSAVGGRRGVRIVTEETNPYSLIDIADQVFVATSGMGFEALMAGKAVSCFGMPFYAGWGLTRDRLALPRRTRTRTLPELFHVFYVMLSRYVDPRTGRRCEIEDLVHRMEEMRPWSMPGRDAAG